MVATWSELRQVPLEIPSAWGERRRAAVGAWDALEGPGPGRAIFESLARKLGSRSAEEARS